jgi:general stress protein 26
MRDAAAMSTGRREVLIGATLAAIAAGTKGAQAQPKVPEHVRTAEPAAILAAAKALIAKDSFTTLITVDIENRPGTRKLDQIAHNRAATLHFADDRSAAYASLMGEARAMKDEWFIANKNPYKGDALKSYFPDFPKDFVLIGFKPFWLEIATGSIPSTTDTWRPQGLTLD